MLAIKELIGQLELDDETRAKEYEKQNEEQDEKYEKLRSEIESYRDATMNVKTKIIKNLEELLSNKSTIQKILEQMDILVGLPIPCEHHETAVDLISKVIDFINNFSNYLDTSKLVSPNEIRESLINVAENLATDLEKYHTKIAQAQTLYLNTKCLKNMINDSIVSEAQKVNETSYGTIPE